jgi:uncharacterized surface protein with fasciclin (FAS1) repeats
MKHKTFFVIILFLLVYACEEDITEREIYQKPDWLEGKLYTQIRTVENLSDFANAIKLVGLDSLIDKSGLYTIFAPNNEAISAYLLSKNYQSLEDIPLDQLKDLISYHIVQNSWSIDQLRSLDIDGWIDPDSRTNNEPRGYKRQSILQESNKEYPVREAYIQGEIETIIVPEGSNNSTRVVYNNSRKYVPLYYDEFMQAAKISGSDYAFYFDNIYEPGNLYFANAKLLVEEVEGANGKIEIAGEIFAENGFIYEIDQVVEVLPNAEQIMEAGQGENNYSQFLNILHQFSEFSYNKEATLSQEGADEGLEVADLYNLSFPGLVFDIHEEITSPSRKYNSSERYTVRYHYGLLAPTNQGFNDLIKGVLTKESGLPHWNTFKDVPLHVKKMIVNSHMSEKPVYESDLNSGFINGEDDEIKVDLDNVVQNEMGSNCTFVGLKEAILPRALSSITALVYLRPGFSNYMYAVEYAGILSAIKKGDAFYSLFVLSNSTCDYSGDSSLIVDPIDLDRGLYTISSFSNSSERFEKRNKTELGLQLMNHVGTTIPEGIAMKEFIPTLGGNFIVIDNNQNPPIVTGGVESTYGYNGDSVLTVTLDEFSSFEFNGKQIPDNGVTYEINAWLRFPTTDLYSRLSEYPKFYSLLIKSGLLDDKVYYRLNFVSEGENYTVFAPSDSAIINYNSDPTHTSLDSLSSYELQKVLLYHFVTGDIIFTDGKKFESSYETARLDESSTAYNKIYSKMHISPGIDRIDILDTSGNVYYSVNEKDGKTNIMGAENIGDESNPNYVITNVIHEVDQVVEFKK